MSRSTRFIVVSVALCSGPVLACKTERSQKVNSNNSVPAARPTTPDMAVPRRAAPRPRVARPRVEPARPAPSGLLLGAIPKAADLTEEARYLYGRLVCAGRAPDGPCKSLDEAVKLYRTSYVRPMRPWLARRRPKKLPSALLYPFSGGDLISALSVFPEQRQFLHFSLEHGGPVMAIRGMSKAAELQARWKAVWMARNLLSAGESFSVDLQKQERARLPGTLPLLLVALRVHGATLTGLSYVKVLPDGRLKRYTRAELQATGPTAKRHAPTWKDPQFSRRFSNVEVRFRLPQDTEDRSVIHVAANLSNAGLTKRPGVLKLIGRLGPHALMIKAASFLMWGDGFSAIRDAIFARAAWGIADVSAPYPVWLVKAGWRLEGYGRFDCLKKKRMHRASLGWRVLFQRPKSRALPFRYGYVDCKGQQHAVLLYRKAKK